MGAFDLGHRYDLTIGEVEASIRMGGILDQHLVLRPFRDLVVVRLSPRVIGVNQTRRCRDNLPHIELDLLEQPLRVQFRTECLSLGQRQARLAACPPAQGRRPEPCPEQSLS